MAIDDSRKQIWDEMQRARERKGVEPELPLQGGDGGGTSGGMEARLAKLEASMDYVKAELGRLAGLPAELARISERVNHLPTTTVVEAVRERLSDLTAESARMTERMSHLPTKAEMKAEIETAVDRAGVRTQRTVAIVGGLVTIAIAAMNYAPKLITSF